MHPNEALIRRLFDPCRTGDRDASAALSTKDAVSRYAAGGPMHGEHGDPMAAAALSSRRS